VSGTARRAPLSDMSRMTQASTEEQSKTILAGICTGMRGQRLRSIMLEIFRLGTTGRTLSPNS
jgi:hypothetical protein